MVGYRFPRGRYLENGPHTVEVTPMKPVEGRTGRTFQPLDPVVIDRVLVQPSAGNALRAAETRLSTGALTDETVTHVQGTGRRWPGGPHSLVRILVGPDGYQGRTFQQSGEVLSYNASPMTTHFRVRIDAIGVDAR